jgi:DNA-binding transcriptional ArsR family regulator
MTPRPVVGDAKRWKALAHPLRGEMLRHLDSRGPATSTTIAEALGENTGTTSYHLRVLADAGIIEEVPERAHVRQHGKWAKASRASGYYTVEDLEALFDDYMALLSKYGHSAGDAPPGARPMQLRMFHIPDEPAEDD